MFQKKKQGLIMVNLHSKFISCTDEANISHVAGEASMLIFYLLQIKSAYLLVD